MSLLDSRSTLLGWLLLAACGGSGGTGPSAVSTCDTPLSISLQPGEFRLVRISESDCLAFAAGNAESEYVVVPYSAAGQETNSGIEGGFRLTTANAGLASLLGAPASLVINPVKSPNAADRFHIGLRQTANELARFYRPAAASRAPGVARPPPELDSEEQFNVCAELSCESFETITTTAKFVGSRGVIWLDNSLLGGANEFTAGDLEYLGLLFDDHIYPIDTTAFGAVSDIDGNQLVDIVVTPTVNALTSDCSDGRIVGFFFGGDLLTNHPGSNRREVFFTIAPQAGGGSCPSVSRSQALRALPPVLIHELQHMISFNQHVLRRGRNDETVWLSEGLSHFAEELGQRLIPDNRCPFSSSCADLFSRGNVQNARAFLEDPEATHLVAPGEGVTLPGRGAAWLFVRWLADHFASDTLLGTSVTRGIVSGLGTGSGAVSSVSGVAFGELVGEWLLANWLDNLSGFPQMGRLRYRTWNLRSLSASQPFPLVPPVTTGVSQHTGVLRAGSGYFLRVVVPTSSEGITAHLTGSNGSSPAPANTDPRFAVVRVK